MGQAVVVGAGFGGIAAALRLRARGWEVTLVDKLDQLGGRAYTYRRNGFTFDGGPTVVTAPFLFDELFSLFGKNRADYIHFVPLYPWYRIQFADSSYFDYGGTLEQTHEQIRKFEPADVDGYQKLLAHTKRIFQVGFTELGDKPFESVWSMMRVAPDLARLGNWRTVWQLACKYIRSEKLRRVFSFQPLLVGGNPYNTTCIYSLIHYLEREWGVHFAMGGTGAIVSGLEKLLREEGVSVRLGCEVAEVSIAAGERKTPFRYAPELFGGSSPTLPAHVTGVRLTTGEQLNADLVCCNADAPMVYRKLVPPAFRRKYTDRKLDAMKYSMGLFVLYFGTRRKYDHVVHHTIILGKEYQSLLRRMFDRFELEWDDISVYLHRPTATDPSMAPAGCDSFYVLVPVPNLQGGQNWDELGPRYRDAVVAYLERTHLPGLRDSICEDFYVTPKYYAETVNTLHGSGFSIQPTFLQSAYFRFHNRSEEVDGLYLVGAGTHPGAGMPGVLCSAKVLEHVLPQTPAKHELAAV